MQSYKIRITNPDCELDFVNGKVLKDGVETNDFKPAFIGDADPDFFGYLTPDGKGIHDIYGGYSKVVSESNITI